MPMSDGVKFSVPYVLGVLDACTQTSKPQETWVSDKIGLTVRDEVNANILMQFIGVRGAVAQTCLNLDELKELKCNIDHMVIYLSEKDDD